VTNLLKFPGIWLQFSLAIYLATPLEAKVSILATPPKWSELDQYQQTITREEFLDLLNTVYAPRGAWKETIKIKEDRAEIKTAVGKPSYRLNFADSRSDQKAVASFWRPKSLIPQKRADKPLDGVHIAIDPGHIGGRWAKIEERWFQVGEAKPVREGDMTLQVAKMLQQRLKSLGAKVTLTRSRAHPATRLRPEKLISEAKESLASRGREATPFRLRKESERLFYRPAEIRKRAQIVNNQLKPDLVLCLHFNAEPWGDPAKPRLVNANHLHFLVTGTWSPEELSFEDQRFDMLQKLLTRSFYEEKQVTKALAAAMRKATELPPFIYNSPNATQIDGSPYIWARNLLANRLFNCPVVYLEPYVMNGREAFTRIQAGDYPGKKVINGKKRPSIFREYADSVAAGLVDYYSQR